MKLLIIYENNPTNFRIYEEIVDEYEYRNLITLHNVYKDKFYEPKYFKWFQEWILDKTPIYDNSQEGKLVPKIEGKYEIVVTGTLANWF